MTVELSIPLSSSYVAQRDPSALLDTIAEWVMCTRPISTQHPYGFWVILLCRTETEEWRFHMWSKDRSAPGGMPAPIHTHEKVVDSRILMGELENITYRVRSTDAGGYPVYVARHISDKYSPENRNLLVKTPERYIPVRASQQTLSVGDAYSVQAHVFHEARVREGILTCTIVRMHSPSPGPVQILGSDGYPPEIEFKRMSASAYEVFKSNFYIGKTC
jgi:hypothetical protein